MKSIYVTFEDEQFSKLAKAKGKMTWDKFIMQLAGLKYKSQSLTS